MQPQAFHSAGKHRVGLCSVKDIESPREIVLVFPKVKIQGMKDLADSDVSVEGGDRQPGPEVIARDVQGDALPDFGRYSLRGGVVLKADLGRGFRAQLVV